MAAIDGVLQMGLISRPGGQTLQFPTYGNIDLSYCR